MTVISVLPSAIITRVIIITDIMIIFLFISSSVIKVTQGGRGGYRRITHKSHLSKKKTKHTHKNKFIEQLQKRDVINCAEAVAWNS